MSRSYQNLVASVPRPTPEQVEAFVRHVSDAENWLKTSLDEGARITVFLDPNAGMRLNKDRDSERFQVERIDPGMELLHGSELVTQEYRSTLGYLNYYTDLGAGTAEVEGELMRLARTPGPGVVDDGMFVPLPQPLCDLASRPGALLHGTFRSTGDPGGLRRFRYAVERLPRLEDGPTRHPFLERIQAWKETCRAQDAAGFQKWLRDDHGQEPSALDESTRWQRYTEWRDEDACGQMHRSQDEEFIRSGIPKEVVERHEKALAMLRDSVPAMLAALGPGG